jgi:pimeloyl-ACP methyl ester carboxylesterase
VALGAGTIPNPQSAIRNGVVALSVLPFQPARSKQFEQRRRWKNLKNYASKALSPGTWARLLKGEINLERIKKNVTASEKPAAGDRNLKDSARDIEKELLEWRGPALFVWGGGDEEAPLARAHFEKLHAAGMGSRECTAFHTIPGANHNFYAQAWREELGKLVSDFLATVSKK